MTTSPHTGGCQCGAVRYRIDGPLGDADICHCRMCQKAGGNLFGAFAGASLAAFTWTRGAPKTFRSSEIVERGFCAECGTSLSFRYTDKPRISISLGSLDDPASAPVKKQYGIESRMPWFDELPNVPGARTDAMVPPDRARKLASRQHPDHDTDIWPPKGEAT